MTLVKCIGQGRSAMSVALSLCHELPKEEGVNSLHTEL